MLIIREIRPTEQDFLKEMLYQAIFVPEGSPKFPPTIVDKPEINKYIIDFVQTGDYCLVAEWENELVGAIWVRQFTELNRGYAFVDNQTPELSLAVSKGFRGKGMGRQLLEQLLGYLTQKGIQQVSLSVDYRNYAKDLYLKQGFEEVRTVFTAVLMIKKLA